MKYTLLALILVSTLFLGLTDPEGPRRDPVPKEQIVAHSSHCAGCHGTDPTGMALVDGEGHDISIYDDWKVSMMGLGAYDPFWRATVKHEVSHFPSAKAAIESTCLKCHAPLGVHQRLHDGLEYSFDEMLQDSLGLDGISCGACHQQSPETYGTSHSGNITLNTDRILYGPFPEPFEGSMKLYVGFTPVYTDLIQSSGVCAGCHTLVSATLDETGSPTGDMFVEQATYHEWLNSTYATQGKECQGCHMPAIEDSVLIATGIKGIEKRHPFALHQFYGANTIMLTLMKENRNILGLADIAPEEEWDESIENNRVSLRSSADVSVSSFSVFNDTLYVEVSVVNKAGHKLPSGNPSRIAWLRVVLTDELTGDTLYANGLLDTEGNIIGRDWPYEPHHEFVRSSDDVQIYEIAISDKQGQLTKTLNGAYQPYKDNRLLPSGFKRTHGTYDTVAVWGNAVYDPDYDALSTRGMDVLEYRIPLDGKTGLADLQISLQYQTIPLRWTHSLFQSDSIPEVSLFKSMYQGYESFTEVLDSMTMEDLSLETSAVKVITHNEIEIFPNPVIDRKLHVKGNILDTRYQLFDIHGTLVQEGILTTEVMLTQNLSSGAYFFMLITKNGVRKASKMIVL